MALDQQAALLYCIVLSIPSLLLKQILATGLQEPLNKLLAENLPRASGPLDRKDLLSGMDPRGLGRPRPWGTRSRGAADQGGGLPPRRRAHSQL